MQSKQAAPHYTPNTHQTFSEKPWYCSQTFHTPPIDSEFNFCAIKSFKYIDYSLKSLRRQTAYINKIPSAGLLGMIHIFTQIYESYPAILLVASNEQNIKWNWAEGTLHAAMVSFLHLSQHRCMNQVVEELID